MIKIEEKIKELFFNKKKRKCCRNFERTKMKKKEERSGKISEFSDWSGWVVGGLFST